jgi:hypothetical protein
MRDEKQRYDNAVTYATLLYQQELCTSREGRMRLPKGTIDACIDTAKKKFNIPDRFDIPKRTIQSRVEKGNPQPSRGPTSPMATIEPLLVEFCCRMNRVFSPLDVAQGLALANSLIDGTHHLADCLQFVQQNCGVEDGVVDYCINLEQGTGKDSFEEITTNSFRKRGRC